MMRKDGKSPPAWRELLAEAAMESGTKRQAATLIAAAELFSQKGYAATTTREIAQRAGVSEGALFKYFATKEALFERLSGLITERICFPLIGYGLDEITAERFPNPKDMFKALLRNRLELIDNNLVPIRILLQELPYRPELRAKFLEFLQRLPFLNAVEAWTRQGLLRDMPAREWPPIILSSLAGFLLSRILILSGDLLPDREKDIENFVDFFVRGLAPQGTEDTENTGDKGGAS
jgi:AcrR family transcriptional regulator